MFATRFSLFFLILFASYAQGQGYLKAEGNKIINDKGEVILRGIGLGGWMLQEPYMLKLSGTVSAQHEIRKKIKDLIGEKKTREFYKAWLENHCTKGDIDSLAAWGFNSVRLPMHYNLFTLPADEERVAGKNTWLTTGFALTDSLLKWCKANKIYLILDLHAAPGGQGNDNAISDRDTSKPSLWQSVSNKEKTIALWQKLASRYANEKWIGGYDLINEPNWGFQDKQDKNGCNEKENKDLKELYISITSAIRKVDKQHIIFIEGNCWANNYEGIFPLWDKNMVISFHKYWNYTDNASIQKFIDYRNNYNVPVWMGETGENSNAWFTDVVSLLEKNKMGWAMWPLKKAGMNNPLQVKLDPGMLQIIKYWEGAAAKPSPRTAFESLLQFAKNTNIKNNIVNRDVVNAIFQEQNKKVAFPFHKNIILPNTVLFATDYDIGRSGSAYFDKDSAEYWVSTNVRTPWNKGGQYRNDGVDIEVCKDVLTNGYNVGWIETGEWLQYTVYAEHDNVYDINVRSASIESGGVKLFLNKLPAGDISLLPTGEMQKWNTFTMKNVKLARGWNEIRVLATVGGFNLNYLQFIPANNTAKLN